MNEYTTPGQSAAVGDNESLYNLLTERIKRTGKDTTIAAYKGADGSWQNITSGEFHTHVLQAAKGLIALGVEAHQAVALFSATRYEWAVLDFALAAIGAVNVPIYDTDSAAQAQRIINDATVCVAFADTQERFNKLASVRKACPSLRQILMIDANAMGVLEGLGVTVSDTQLQQRIDAVRADDVATIVYTSGSTGVPKGAELTHRNFMSITRGASVALHEIIADGYPRLLLFLPLAHCFARFIQYASVHADYGVVGFVADTRSLLPDLRSFEPTYMLGVPRVFEKVYNAASRKAGMGLKGKLFAKATLAAREWSKEEQAGIPHSPQAIAEHALYEMLVYKAIRGALGPKIQYVACGGAPLDPDLAHFFNGIGLPMIQGYGLTETAAPFAATRVTDNLIGTVGQPAPGSSVRIAEDGELQVSGPNVFRGYHNMPEKTAEVFTADGWFKTGDLGSIDDAGRITITGRKKDIIITAGGKNVSPIPLEQTIAQCPLVEHAVVIGDQKPFVSALVTLDPEALALWLPTQGFEVGSGVGAGYASHDASHAATHAASHDETHAETHTSSHAVSLNLVEFALKRLDIHAAIRAEIQEYINRANANVSRAESVRKFAIVHEQFTQENGCLTPSMKVVRPAVLRVFSPVIEREIYAK